MTTARSAQEEQRQQAYQQKLREIQAQREQQMREKLQQLKAEYVSAYSLPLNYPAKVTSIADDDDDHDDNKAKNSTIRTSKDFINARLLEAGLPLGGGAPSKLTLGDHSTKVQRFINDLEGTGCYDSVQVHIGNEKDSSNNNSPSEPQNQKHIPLEMFDVTVRLKEKRWYKIYIGGGVNSEDLSSLGASGASGTAFGGTGVALGSLPKLQFETSASLLNLSGYADVSTALYSVDQTGASSFKFTHDRPLCSWLPKHSQMYDWLMPRDPRLVNDDEKENTNNDNVDELQVYMDDDAQYTLGGGSHTTLGIHAMSQEQDFESTRSSKEFSRSIGLRLANHCRGASRGPGMGGANKPSISPPETMAGPYFFLDWNACLRDTLPRRHPEFPFTLDCSPEVAKQAGTALKHSLTGGVYMNSCLTDDRYDPTMGYDAHLVGEVAGPPGDHGFIKLKCGGAFHFPMELLRMMTVGLESTNDNTVDEDSTSVMGLTFHSSFNFGIARPLTFNGLCNNLGGIPLSDRFYTGGSGQLRGFPPAGIGPRATKGGSSTPGGDSLGGEMFYTSTFAASVPLPSYFATLRQNGARLFGFANAGTCASVCPSVGFESLSACSRIINSSRVAVGGGVSMGTPMGRFELTYAVPWRYGSKDATKNVQMGFGFSFG